MLTDCGDAFYVLRRHHHCEIANDVASSTQTTNNYIRINVSPVKA